MARFRSRFWPVACWSLLALSASGALAHGTTAGDLPLTTHTLQLRHRKPAEVVALFAREKVSGTQGERLRGARAGIEGVLLPEGIDAVLRDGPDTLTLVGFENRFEHLAACLQVVDVPVQKVGERVRVTLTLHSASARDLWQRLLRLPEGAARVQEGQLVLEGRPAWLHGALREVIRAELRLPQANSPDQP